MQVLTRTTLCLMCVLFIYLLWSDLEKIESIKISNNVEEINFIPDTSAKVKFNKKRIIPDNSEFNEIIKRPLFNDDRLPLVYVAPEKPDTNNKSTKPKNPVEQYRLNAVVITPEKQIAIIQRNKNKELLRVSLGESIDDWELTDITHHSIKLKNGVQIKILELEIKASVKRAATTKSKEKSTLKNKNTKTETISRIQEKVNQEKINTIKAEK